MPARVHIIGCKNSGKTTLIVDLVTCFKARGLRVGTVKHTHHRHELDTPGKDSFRHREAGADAVGILSLGMDAIFWPHVSQPATEDTAARYAQFEALMSDCDLILVEGHSRIAGLKLEVWRAATESAPVAAAQADIAAVISDDQPDVACAVWPRSDVAALADRILGMIHS